MKKSDRERLRKIADSWTKLKKQIDERHITPDNLMDDEFLQWAVTTPLYNIGEQVYQLSDDLKQSYSALPWKAVAGLRHRLVHDYEGINWTIIVDVIFHEMDPFVDAIVVILRQLEDH